MKSNLLELLADPRFDRYVGRTACIRLAVLAKHISGTGTLASIARRHRVTKAAMTAHARRAREIFGEEV